ncbi:MAG: hypothetical protein QOJ32_3415 [Frankiaceae bacterium]|nr:hypothetical protein [Frankiaceae bacterium]
MHRRSTAWGQRGCRRVSTGGAALAAAALLTTSLTWSPSQDTPALRPAADLQGQTTAAADDLGVRDAEADAAATRLAEVTTQVRDARTALTTARAQLATARGDLTGAQNELAASQTAQRLAQDKVDAATATLNTARDQLRVMVRSALQNGVGSDLDVLLQSGSPDELADRMGLLDHLSKARNARITALTAARDVVAGEVRQLDLARGRSADAVRSADAQVTRVATLVDGARDAEQRLVSAQTDQQAVVDRARLAALGAQARYDALRKASDDLTALLAARARLDAAVPDSSGFLPPVVAASGLVRPTVGVLTSSFGYRVDPLGRGRRFHAGQDFGAPLGSPILAATDGTVVYAGWANGYGNYTCIDRGRGFATCYGHQSRILVRVGQLVKAGEEIGLVGSTGNSTGPHLHFEVRLNGVPVDPRPYLT